MENFNIDIINQIVFLVVNDDEFSDSSSSNSDDNDDFIAEILAEQERNQIPKINNYLGTVHMMNPDTFKSHFRLTRGSLEIIRNAIAPMFARASANIHGGHPNITLDKALLATVWTLANQESFRGVSERFNVTRSNLHKYFLLICGYLCQTDIFLNWPNENALQQIRQDFSNLRGPTGFPGVIAAVDGMHIPIPAPKEDPASYYNRKGFHSIILQGMCDAKCRFIDVFVGWPGSSHDGRVWRESPIGSALSQELIVLPEGTHILGDSAYPLLPYLMVPYRDNGHLTRTHRKYNFKLSSKRVLIEQTFGLLRCRFRRLKYLNMTLMNQIKIVIIAACVLHNICISNNDYVDVDEDANALVEDIEHQEENINPAEKRDRIADWLSRN